MRSSVNAALESNATRSICSGLVNRLGWRSSFWSDIYPFGDAHLLPAGVGFAAGAAARHRAIWTWFSRKLGCQLGVVGEGRRSTQSRHQLPQSRRPKAAVRTHRQSIKGAHGVVHISGQQSRRFRYGALIEAVWAHPIHASCFRTDRVRSSTVQA